VVEHHAAHAHAEIRRAAGVRPRFVWRRRRLSPAASFLTRFADAVRFVLAGTKSHWFSDHGNVGLLDETLLQMRCARN
jgi:hypothetical protein